MVLLARPRLVQILTLAESQRYKNVSLRGLPVPIDHNAPVLTVFDFPTLFSLAHSMVIGITRGIWQALRHGHDKVTY